MAPAALVTGGSSGIGLAVARSLSDARYGVTIAARGEGRLQDVAGTRLHPVRADVSSEADVARLLDAHLERFGRLDVLVNGAGVELHGPLQEMATSAIDGQLAVNLRGPILLTRAALAELRAAGAEHGKALVVNVASLAGKSGQGQFAAYSASKAGVIAFSQALQHELAEDGVQVTAVCPGFVDTPMVEPWAPIEPAAMLPPEDVARTVRFLLETSPVARVGEIVLGRAVMVPPI